MCVTTGSEESLLDQTRALILTHLESGENCLDRVALDLRISGRSLSRRLEKEGTTFRLLRDEVRCKLAMMFLKQGDLSLAEIAYRLGYKEQSSFNHAFKRWTGINPSAVRGQDEDNRH